MISSAGEHFGAFSRTIFLQTGELLSVSIWTTVRSRWLFAAWLQARCNHKRSAASLNASGVSYCIRLERSPFQRRVEHSCADVWYSQLRGEVITTRRERRPCGRDRSGFGLTPEPQQQRLRKHGPDR